MENNELLKHIYEDSKMGEYALSRLIKELKEKDNKIKIILEDIYKKYLYFSEKSFKILKKDIPDIDFKAKLGTYFGIKKEVNNDNSDAAIAGMLIQGLSMGIIEIEKKLTVYSNCEKKIVKIALDFKTFQEEYIVKMKEYL